MGVKEDNHPGQYPEWHPTLIVMSGHSLTRTMALNSEVQKTLGACPPCRNFEHNRPTHQGPHIPDLTLILSVSTRKSALKKHAQNKGIPM